MYRLNIDINVQDVIDTLAKRIAQLEIEKAVLTAQLIAYSAKEDNQEI